MRVRFSSLTLVHSNLQEVTSVDTDSMNTCTKCNQEKPWSEFGPAKKNKSGYRNICKPCHAKYMRDYYIRFPDKAKANKERQVYRDSSRNRFTRHHFTKEQYDQLLSIYEGKCWSCKDREGVVIDHDHSCCPGTFSCGFCVRGILCSQCNTALGLLAERLDYIKNLEIYLTQVNAPEALR